MSDIVPVKVFGLKQIAAGKSDVFKVDPRLIRVKAGWNSRNMEDPDNANHIESLAQSIAEIGVKTPLVVYWENDAPVVADGHCRLAATVLAISRGYDIKTVPVMTEGRHSNEGDRLLSQVVRNSGKNLTPIEQAGVFKRLLDFGWPESDIAKKVGCSQQRVADLLRLITSPPEMVSMVAKGQVSADFATQTLRKHKGDKVGATRALAQAVDTATALGKRKASAKHLKPAPVADEAREADAQPVADQAEPRAPAAAPGVVVHQAPMAHPAYAAGIRRMIELAQLHIDEERTDPESHNVQVVEALEKLKAAMDAELRAEASEAA